MQHKLLPICPFFFILVLCCQFVAAFILCCAVGKRDQVTQLQRQELSSFASHTPYKSLTWHYTHTMFIQLPLDFLGIIPGFIHHLTRTRSISYSFAYFSQSVIKPGSNLKKLDSSSDMHVYLHICQQAV